MSKVLLAWEWLPGPCREEKDIPPLLRLPHAPTVEYYTYTPPTRCYKDDRLPVVCIHIQHPPTLHRHMQNKHRPVREEDMPVGRNLSRHVYQLCNMRP